MDISYLLFLQQMRQSLGNVFDNFMMQITSFGEATITFILLAGIYWCVNKRVGQYILFNISIGCTLNQFFKDAFQIERPWIRDKRIMPVEGALETAGGYSFPSGHTARAVAVWGAIGGSSWKSKIKKSKKIAFFSWLILLLIMFSRNYLGVHTLKDVLVSFLLGLICLSVTDKVMLWVDAIDEKAKKRDIIVAITVSIILFLPMLKVGCISNAGTGFGFLFGWIIERRYIDFKIEACWQKRCLQFAIGSLAIISILNLLPPILTFFIPSRYAGFFTMFILAFFITAFYPFLLSSPRWYKKGIILCIIIPCILLIGVFYKARHVANVSVNSSTMVEKNVENLTHDVDKDKSQVKGAINREQVLTKIIAHRGYSSVFPENTLSSFAGAIDIGADMIELDVQETKDGVIVVFHDDDLTRVAGVEGKISDYTYAELSQVEVGSWFSEEYRGEKIPTLAEVLNLIQGSELQVYLELKDIGEVDGFVESVLSVTQECGMRDRCIYASFQYAYLKKFKEIDNSLPTLLNTTSAEATLPEQFDVDYFGLNLNTTTRELIEAIHAADKYAFVWTVNEPEDMKKMVDMGADGIVTNRAGLAKVVTKSEYSFLNDYYINAITMPGLYGNTLNDACGDMVVQGFTRVDENLVISAYSYSAKNNSILYILDSTGTLVKIIDLGFKAHVGGIAYDTEHHLIWITGADGCVYSLVWKDIIKSVDGKAGPVLYCIGVGLRNHNNEKVASFLTVDTDKLFVGSYVDGKSGRLKEYSITDPYKPVEISEREIPEHIQGVTFAKNQNGTQMLLSQGRYTEDSKLLIFDYNEETKVFEEPQIQFILPEGVEQFQMTNEGMYLLFESSARPYRETARLVNDQIYLVNMNFLN